MEKAKFLTLNIDAKAYNRIIRVTKKGDGGTSDLHISVSFFKQITEPLDFIRLKCQGCYADFKLNKWRKNDKEIIISFGDLIDHNKTVIHEPKKTKQIIVVTKKIFTYIQLNINFPK